MNIYNNISRVALNSGLNAQELRYTKLTMHSISANILFICLSAKLTEELLMLNRNSPLDFSQDNIRNRRHRHLQTFK